MNSTTTLEKTTEKPMEFVPFGAADKIKLTVGLVQSTVCIPTRSGKVCSARDAVRFMMLCQAQRLNPYAGDCYLCGYDGKNGPVFSLITAHQAFLKRAETCADYEGMESGIILADDNGVCSEREGDFVLEAENCVGGWARVHRKGRKPTYRRLSIAAMMPNYETPFWSKAKAPGQIVKCAEADALRATFPTLLGGLYTGEQLNMNATISSLGAIELPQVGIPAALPETTQQVTDEAAQASAPREKLSPQAELEGIIAAAGFTFRHFVAWTQETQDLEGVDSWTQFSEVPTDFAKRMLKAQTGLIQGLGKVKAGVV
jgi:phage recombination protein Bet